MSNEIPTTVKILGVDYPIPMDCPNFKYLMANCRSLQTYEYVNDNVQVLLNNDELRLCWIVACVAESHFMWKAKIVEQISTSTGAQYVDKMARVREYLNAASLWGKLAHPE